MEISLGFISGLVIKIFALLTPTAILSAFLAYSRGMGKMAKIWIACKTGIAIYIIGQVLFLFGPALFGIFGFTLDAFRIGVGLLLFLSAIEIMNDDDAAPPHKKGGDISVVPLAIPLGMGPSTIGAVMVMGAQAQHTQDHIIGGICLFLAALGVTVLLCLAEQVQKLIGKTGILVMSKLTALLISAIAAQVIFTGIKAFLKHF